jgi:hypothetical protein
MVYNRFSPHSSHNSLENFHHLRQTASVSDYIQKFVESMSLMQMDYPHLTEPYFISSFIAGLRDGIKHYIIPHSPQTLCDAYWKAKELEKGILVKKKSLLTSSNSYSKPNTTYTPATPTKPITPSPTPPLPKPQPPPQANPPQPNKPLPFKKEPGKCWVCQEPWTPKHKFLCKFQRVVHAMAVDPDDWLLAE